MNLVKRMIYKCIVAGVKTCIWLFLDLRVWGRENIPKGSKIFVINHISSHDIIFALIFGELLHIVIGPGYKNPFVARLFDAFEQINSMPSHRNTVVDEAVKYLNRGESVYMAPEGDFQDQFKLGRFHSGVARMYRKSGAPIIPMAMLAPKSSFREVPGTTEVDGRTYRNKIVWKGPYCINIGEPFYPEIPEGTEHEQDQAILDQLKQRLEFLIHDARVNKFWL